MKISQLAMDMERGRVCRGGSDGVSARPSATVGWQAHPVFEGVELKHLVTGADTGGALSCHMVRVRPGCELREHVHEGQGELHEVVSGTGRAEVAGTALDYAPGVVAIIERGTRHSVLAGDEGLVLLAKFFPALL